MSLLPRQVPEGLSKQGTAVPLSRLAHVLAVGAADAADAMPSADSPPTPAPEPTPPPAAPTPAPPSSGPTVSGPDYNYPDPRPIGEMDLATPGLASTHGDFTFAKEDATYTTVLHKTNGKKLTHADGVIDSCYYSGGPTSMEITFAGMGKVVSTVIVTKLEDTKYSASYQDYDDLPSADLQPADALMDYLVAVAVEVTEYGY